MRRCLIDCDINGIRKLWAHVAPHLISEAQDDEQTLISIHMARTTAESIPFRFRAYSHRWLTERSLPSQLPDDMKPRAERMYPRVISAVGICVATLGNKKTDYHLAVMRGMGDVVENYYADGIEDPATIKAGMKEVHDRLRKQR